MSSATSHNSSSSTNTSGRASSSSSQPTQACAACKYQRRKCNPDCTLAPYFPADAQRQFLNAHRLFGVSNILKIIRGLDPVQRTEAMRSIIFQSNARAHDPVGGCYRIILELERHIEREQAELALVLRQLAVCRAQAQAAAMAQANPQTLPPDLGIHPNLLITANEDGDEAAAMYANHQADFVPTASPVQQQQYYNYFYYDGGGDTNNDNNNSHSNKSSLNNNNNNNNNHNGMEMELAHSVSSMLSLQQQCGEDDVKPLVDVFEVRQAFEMEDEEDENSKDVAAPAAFHCSTKMELKEEHNHMEHVKEHDLKGAASLFTLTNCNTSSI